MAAQPLPHFTLGEYLKMERESEARNEFIRGTVVTMAKGTVNQDGLRLRR